MTAPSVSSGGWADVPFGEFLQLLRRNGFVVGLRHYARMMSLIDSLGPDCPPTRLRSMLAPLFATTPEQQDRFYRLFDQWFPMFVPRVSGEFRTGSVEASPDIAVPGPQSRRGRPKVRRRLLPLVAGVAAASLLVMLWWGMTRETGLPSPAADPAVPANPLPPQGQPQILPQPVIPTVTPDESIQLDRQVDWRAVRFAIALLVVVGFMANEWRHYRRRRMVLERQRRERPPLVWPIRVEAASTPLVESAEFLTAARRLRERQTGDRERLDIAATVAATIRAQGRPVLKYVKETRPPEYLILIERASARDHQARLYLHLIEHLIAEGVHATVYWCDEDPRICDPVIDGPTATLLELRHKYPSYRLLLFGSGDGLIDPISGRRKPWVADALNWPDRALLTPEGMDSWGARELALAGHLIVLPGTLAGLQAAIDHFQIPTRGELGERRHRLSRVPEPDAKDAVRAIKTYLGPRGLQWVSACAVYPDLQWNLTLHLGMLPELGGSIDEKLLTKIVRLPWFRRGAIPDDVRAVLLRVIEPEVERAARRTVIALLERNPAPPETIAASRFELDLVVQKFALQSRTRARRRELARVARQAPRERVMAELAVLRLTEGDPTSPVAMRLPERLRDVFFQGGMSVLGLTSGARSLVAVALIVGVLFVGPGQVVASPQVAAEERTDSAQTPSAPDSNLTITPPVARDSLTTPVATNAATPTPPSNLQPAADSQATPPVAAPVVAAAPPPAPGTRVDSLTNDTRGREPVNLPPPIAIVRIGTETPNAVLYLGGAALRPLEALQLVPVPAGEAIALSIRAAGCESWDTTVTVGRGDTASLGMRAARCAAAPDPAVERRLVDDAIMIARGQLQGTWTSLNKARAATVTYGSDNERRELTDAIREGVTWIVLALRPRSTDGPPVTADSIYLVGDVRFDWRTFVGSNQRRWATIGLTFDRTTSTPQLQRIHITALRRVP